MNQKKISANGLISVVIVNDNVGLFLVECIRRTAFPQIDKFIVIDNDSSAQACFSALQSTAANKSYNLSGGEVLTYREMVTRVFMALGSKPRLLSVPFPFFRLADALVHILPRYRKWSTTMAERMNQDLVFDHIDAKNDFDYSPLGFVLSAANLPQ